MPNYLSKYFVCQVPLSSGSLDRCAACQKHHIYRRKSVIRLCQQPVHLEIILLSIVGAQFDLL